MVSIYSERIKKQKLLIVDDSEMNRSILADMLGDEYEIVEAEDGVQAVSVLEKQASELSLVLLDMVMPRMNGMEVLTVMQQNRWLEDIPVIMISAESGTSYIQQAYEMGVTDFIVRPFDALIVHRRVVNTVLLYAKQKKLIELVAEQIQEKEQSNNLMIDILSHIVEFRNGESGLHVLHVHTLTELLLRQVVEKTDRYNISPADISLIATASALHDIGKIGIDEKILNKPGRLTEEEFEVMKTHSMLGADMLRDLPIHQEEPLLKMAYEICRWHHERYDGRGYPDRLKGDEIPISAQIVAMADVYDALTSKRVYKAAFPHETAIKMILEGKCGVFNPLLLECLRDIAPILPERLERDTRSQNVRYDHWTLTQEALNRKQVKVSERSLQLMDHERMKYSFFAELSEEIQFEYTLAPPALNLSPWGANRVGTDEFILDPAHSDVIQAILGPRAWGDLSKALRATTPEQPVVHYECELRYNGQSRWHRIIARAIWAGSDSPEYNGCIGKAIDIHDSLMRLSELEKQASHDPLTGLLNQAYAKKRILEWMQRCPDNNFLLVICDLDKFKSANDTYGHLFGNGVLKHVSEKLRHNTRGNDIVARIGGDEFLLFIQCDGNAEAVIERIFSSLLGQYESFTISLSMGVARTAQVGREFESLFRAADQALYAAKRAGRGRYCFHDPSMEDMTSSITPIDSHKIEERRKAD